jgi:hypothetical protein
MEIIEELRAMLIKFYSDTDVRDVLKRLELELNGDAICASCSHLKFYHREKGHCAGGLDDRQHYVVCACLEFTQDDSGDSQQVMLKNGLVVNKKEIESFTDVWEK